MLTESISGTFLRFIEPLLEELGSPDPEQAEFNAVIKAGWTVWNAVVKNDVEGDPAFLLLMKEAIPAPLSAITDSLVERKRKLFADACFLIGVCELRTKSDGAVTLYADARATKPKISSSIF